MGSSFTGGVKDPILTGVYQRLLIALIGWGVSICKVGTTLPINPTHDEVSSGTFPIDREAKTNPSTGFSSDVKEDSLISPVDKPFKSETTERI